MEVVYTSKAQEDIAYWKTSGNKRAMAKISQLIDAIIQNPFQGIGKPEALKENLSGCWSRHINHEHRIVYEVIDNRIVVHSLKGHY